jgi:threonine dehydratase
LIPLDEIRRARETIGETAVRTPLVQLHDHGAPAEIYLKLENLQPIGSFKIRGATNAVRQAPLDAVARGLVTASAGNMAQGVAWLARELGVQATIVVPETAPDAKLAAIERLGGSIVKVPYERWWQAMTESRYEDVDGLFVHPTQDDLVMAGNGTIGLEIVEDLPDLDAVVVPWGGGGLTVGIASAVRALAPDVRVYTVEPETGAALSASLAAGRPQEARFVPSFVDGAGSPRLLPKMWELARPLVHGALAVSLDAAAAAVRLLAQHVRVVAEGAGALAPAAAIAGEAGSGKIVCIVSGGNIDLSRLAAILGGRTPEV